MNPYQVPVPYRGIEKKKQRMLMIRPSYPPMYHENEVPCLSDISEVAVIVNDAWKVGDLVEWWTNDCYWSGRIKQLVGDDKAMVIIFNWFLLLHLTVEIDNVLVS